MLFVPLKSAHIPPPTCPSVGGILSPLIQNFQKEDPGRSKMQSYTHDKTTFACNTFRGLKGNWRFWNCLFIFTNLTFNPLHSLSTFLRQSPLDLKHCTSLLKYISNIKTLSVKIVDGMQFKVLHGHHTEQFALTPSSNSCWPNLEFFPQNYLTYLTATKSFWIFLLL